MLAISKNDVAGPESGALAAGEPLPVAVGQTIVGKYAIDAIIGVGGMGVVASATHVALGQRVAIKVMRTTRMNPESADRFLREARAAVSLKSSHVAKVLDVGTLESGLPFMVMELLEGSDLASQLEARGALPYTEAVEYVLQACDAISEAHALGIVHRDLKPENLFVTVRRDGTALVKVLDFGISKNTSTVEIAESSAPRRAITHESTVMGSPLYMSPEQVRSAKHVDGRTDIWALGAILFELVAGRSAFYAESVPDIFVKILEKPAPRLEDALRDPPAGLAETVARCLEKERERRFQSVDELAAALANLGVRPTAPTVPPWDRGVEIAIDENGDGDLAPVAVPAAIVSAPIALPPRRVAAETFVLPGRSRSGGALKWAVAFALIAGVAGGAYAFRGRLAAALAPKASAKVVAPLPEAEAPASSVAITITPASTPAPAPPPSERASGETSARAAVDVPVRAGKPRSGGRAPKSSSVASTPVTTAVADPPPSAPPAPSLRRTDW